MSARSMLVLLCIGAVASGAGESTPGAPQTRALAAAGLVHTARSVGHTEASASRAGMARVGVLLRYAERLDPDDVPANRQLLGYYRQLGRIKKDLVDVPHAVEVGRRYLGARPDDFAAGLQWIGWSLVGLDQAEQRIELLDGVVGDARLAKAIRSVAAAEACGIYLRQSDMDKAKGAFALARELDPYGPRVAALAGQFDKDLPEVELLGRALEFVRGNPGEMRAAWPVGRLLQAAGLYAEALPYYQHAYDLAAAKPSTPRALQLFLVDYLNTLLDAGKAADAVEVFEPLMGKFGQALALRGLMVEAYRALKDKAKADTHVKAMAQLYKPLMAPDMIRSAGQAAEIGWYYVAYDRRPPEALKWAREAHAKTPHDPYVQRVLGAAELAAGHIDPGVNRLKLLTGKDAHAASALARHYVDTGAIASATKVLTEAAREGVRTGTGWRSAAEVARSKGIAIPPAGDAEPMRRLLKAQPAGVLKMVAHTEQFIRVSVKAVRPQVAPGEPIEVTVELANLSDGPVPLGQWGLLKPIVFLSVDVAGAARKRFDNLCSAILPAPRYLQAGKSVGLTVRLDIGRLEQFLASRPLETFDLTVRSLIDPLQVGTRWQSSVPALKTPAVTIRRAPLFDRAGGEAAARTALGLIVRDLRRGDAAA
ncbi:MAG: tetratricopeptide repeat protein, partial [Planctomycetota bacterium]